MKNPSAKLPHPSKVQTKTHRRTVEACLATALALFCALVLLLLFRLDVGPPGLLWGALAAVAPVPVYVAVALWLDRYESEPPWMLALAFGWGATVAVFFSYIIDSTLAILLAAVVGPENTTFLTVPFVAPVVEETAKFAVLLVLYFWKTDEFDGVVDGIVYAAMIGLGFAMTENILYYSSALAEGAWAGLAGTFFLRGVLAPFSHPLYTAMSGIGLGMAVRSDHRSIQISSAASGLALAMVLHFLWNSGALMTSLLGEHAPEAFLGQYILIWVPVFVGFLALIFYSLVEEGRILRRWLQGEVERGALSIAEYESLCSVSGRLRVSLRTLTRCGLRAWWVRRKLHQVASELAFFRDRLARGAVASGPSSEVYEEDYRRQLLALRREETDKLHGNRRYWGGT